MQHIFITRKIPQEGLDLLSDFSLEIFPAKRSPTKRELIRGVKKADGVICLLSNVMDKEIMDAGHLRVISNYAAGVNNIDIDYATQKGVIVTNTPDVLTNATADLTWALILSVTRRIVESDVFLREGKFEGWEPMLLCGTELADKKLGIVGMGRIGKAVALRASGFGMEVLYHSRKEEDVEGQWVTLEELISQSDIVSLHVPLTSETRHLIGEKELSTMKKEAYLINTSRGPVVDEKALVFALRKKRIAGAGLDVYEFEPKVSEGLLKMKNVVLLPHIGSATVETRRRMAVVAAQNLKDALLGRRPAHVVNPSVLV